MTSWLPGRWTTPIARRRVVCGLAETATTCSPTRRFTRVDLPTFGRPASATRPDLYTSSVTARTARAGARRRRARRRLRVHRDGLEPAVARSHGGEEGAPLGAHRHAKGGVLDVDADDRLGV